ncbi:hypothetical protein BOTBODRAFT_72320, partial [Botryobasidium botryosum FD-172 SS1]
KYARDFVWSDSHATRITLADATETMPPLPAPPESSHYGAGAETVKNYPHLFPIVTPINKFAFKNYLSTHPNRPLVDSVLRGLDEGFWPWADPDDPDRPVTYDGSHRPIK